MQGLLFLYDFRSIASSRSQMDGHLIVSLPEERKIQVEGPRVPVRTGHEPVGHSVIVCAENEVEPLEPERQFTEREAKSRRARRTARILSGPRTLPRLFPERPPPLRFSCSWRLSLLIVASCCKRMNFKLIRVKSPSGTKVGRFAYLCRRN